MKYTKNDNPFYFNIKWLTGLIAVSSFMLAFHCIESKLPDLIEHIITGLLYSALILLMNEVIFLYRDKKEFGKLKGTYFRKEWFEKIEKGLRAEDLIKEEVEKKYNSGKQVMHGTSYYKFLYGDGLDRKIELRYLYKGLYSGRADYPRFWDNLQGHTHVNLNLHLSNDLTTGTGTYSYEEINDSGKYSFQTSGLDGHEIIIQYKNIIPSGIAEGYEVWKKID